MNSAEHYLHRGIVASATIETAGTNTDDNSMADTSGIRCTDSPDFLVITFVSYEKLDYESGSWMPLEKPLPYKVAISFASFWLNSKDHLSFILPTIGESGSLSLEEGE